MKNKGKPADWICIQTDRSQSRRPVVDVWYGDFTKLNTNNK